ncbi:proline-rich protein 2-like [Cervus canadensis]|uniref:proline-rich protein 2-like n=1 Tax=Cervus canadensis TaxID=1574408 RepID=UPI001C9E99DF|nr:proline-rich protein 2-like [Cervus canadensis]
MPCPPAALRPRPGQGPGPGTPPPSPPSPQGPAPPRPTPRAPPSSPPPWEGRGLYPTASGTWHSALLYPQEPALRTPTPGPQSWRPDRRNPASRIPHQPTAGNPALRAAPGATFLRLVASSRSALSCSRGAPAFRGSPWPAQEMTGASPGEDFFPKPVAWSLLSPRFLLESQKSQEL